jgi:predicted dehydrogenase
MERIRAAVVGCGGMGSLHTHNSRFIPELDVVAFVDRTEHRAGKLFADAEAGEYWTSSLDRVLEDASIHAVLIATGWQRRAHVNIAVAVAQAGKHIFIEKPMAADPAECDEIITAVRASGVTLMADYCLRYAPLVRKALEIVGAPRLSAVQCMDEMGTSLIDNGCHLVDLACWINGGRPRTVSAAGARFAESPESVQYGIDQLVCSLTFPNGSIASIILGELGVNPYMSKFSVQLFGDSIGAALVDRFRDLRLWGCELEEIRYRIDTVSRGRHGYMGHFEALQAFTRCIADSAPSPISPEEARLAIDVIFTGFEAARTGTVITMA